MKTSKGNKKRLAIRIALVTLAVLAITFSASAMYMYYQLDRVKINRISKSNEDLGITGIEEELQEIPPPADLKKVEENKSNIIESKPIVLKEEKKEGNQIINIALFGIDTGRQRYEAVHSDAIMILSIDKIHKKIKLSSFIRDTYVNVDGHGKRRINSAYMYGGPQLAIKTLNKNFRMNIRDYYTVNFSGLADIVDSVGGLELDIKQNEIDEINKYMREVAKIKRQRPVPIRSPGVQMLNGRQAVAYARIRKVGNGDFDRTERQKEVLTALIKKVQRQGPGRYPFIITRLLPYVETSMSKGDIIKTGTDMFSAGITDVEWCRFPLNGYCEGKIINKAWYLVTDIEATRRHIHEFIYKDVMPSSRRLRK